MSWLRQRTETVVDATVRNSFEIDASMLDAAALN